MRTFFSYFFGLMITFISLLIIPVDRMFDQVMNTQKLLINVKTAGLHGQIAGLTTKMILEQKPLQDINKTQIAPTEEEVQKIVNDVFPEEWFLNNIETVHRNLITFVTEPVGRTDRFAGVIVSDRKNMLSENLSLLMAQKINALPDCAPSELIKMRSFLPATNKGTGNFFYNFEMNCKPPDPIRGLILKSVRKDLERAMNALPDSLILLRYDQIDKSGKEFKGLKSAFIFSQSFAAIGYGVLFSLFVVIAVINYKNLQNLLQRLGFPFILTSILMSIPFFFLISRMNDIFTGNSMQFKYSKSSEPIGNEAAGLFISFIKTVTEHYCWDMIYFCGFLFLIGAALFAASRFSKLKPLSPLDQGHETNL